MITVDCGISAVEEAEWARQNGLDLIITDHHKPQDELPAAVAIVNPQLDPDYPCPYLAGCGVAFKLAEALAEAATGERSTGSPLDRTRRHRHRSRRRAPPGRESRLWSAQAWPSLMPDGAVPGLQALRAVAGVHTEVTAGHVGFVLAPRLNTVGRVGDPSIGLNLLLAPTYDEALPLARRLEEENGEPAPARG